MGLQWFPVAALKLDDPTIDIARGNHDQGIMSPMVSIKLSSTGIGQMKRSRSDTLLIREATASDLPDLMRLYAQPDLDDGKILPPADARRILDRIAHYPNYKIYVAIREGYVAGTFALLIMDNLGHRGKPSAIIEDVAVDPALHRHGIGKAMMQYAIGRASEYGCYKAVLSSNLKRKKAHAFYDSLGFERHGYSFRVDLR